MEAHQQQRPTPMVTFNKTSAGKTKPRLAVAVDGSTVSHKAFEVALQFYQRLPGSLLYVIHVFDPRKTYLPQHLTPTHIEHEVANVLLKLRLEGAEFHAVERQQGETTCEALARQAKHLNIDLLFIGSFGRKKDGPDKVHVGVLGTVADGSLRTTDADICMVKSTSYAMEGSSTFLVPVDLSAKSGYAFKTVLHHLATPDDEIIVVSYQSQHRTTPSDIPGQEEANQAHIITEQDMAQYKQALAQWGGKSHVEIETLDIGQSVANGILERAKREECDFIVMGIAGNDNRDIGSVTENVMQEARCTTFAVKNPHYVDERPPPRKSIDLGIKSAGQMD